jgi:hypothetical protein
MKSFGRLLRRLRGQTPLPTLAAQAQLDPEELSQIEAGRVPVDEILARRILKEGFALKKPDIDRLILGIQLYDLGLKDNDLRQLVIAVIRKETPPSVEAALKELYRRSTGE